MIVLLTRRVVGFSRNSLRTHVFKQFLTSGSDTSESETPNPNPLSQTFSPSTLQLTTEPHEAVTSRPEDFEQRRDLDVILTERAARFYDPALMGLQKEKCLLVSVELKMDARRLMNRKSVEFSHLESLSELSELVGTAGLQVVGNVVQKMSGPSAKTYIGPGKATDIIAAVNATGASVIVVDDDLTAKQQRNLEDLLIENGGRELKLLDRTAIILEIFAQHAKSREGQLQVEVAMLEYRMSRGPSASGDVGRDSGAGFRGPGESKLETDKRLIKLRIQLLKDAISDLKNQRENHRDSRKRLGLPVIALVGYTNAGKSTLLNRLCKAGVLAENMLFATLDPTTRKVALPRTNKKPDEEKGRHSKGQEVLLTDTVGFISKLPTDLIAAFRATLEEVQNADVLIHVCDRSSPVWKKQRETVLRELDSIGCYKTPIVELWNKIDALPDCEDIMLEAATLPIDVEGGIEDADGIDGSKPSSDDLSLSRVASELAPELTDADDMALSGDVDSIETFASPQATASIDGVRSTHRADRRIFTVAASALTGVGFDDFLATLEDALSLLLKSIDVFIPYDKDDGIIARIFSQGSVDEIEYKNSGTRLVCRVPESLFTRLRPFQIKT